MMGGSHLTINSGGDRTGWEGTILK